MSRIWLLRKMRNEVKSEVMVNFYYASIHSLIQYGIYLWGHSTEVDAILKSQKTCLRIIDKKPSRYHCRSLFIKYGIQTVHSLYVYETLKTAVNQGIISSANTNCAHSHNTRHNFVSTGEDDGTFSLRAKRLFNKLPLELKKNCKK